MSEALEIKEQKAVKSRTYACCPICSKTLVQADYIRNGISPGIGMILKQL